MRSRGTYVNSKFTVFRWCRHVSPSELKMPSPRNVSIELWNNPPPAPQQSRVLKWSARHFETPTPAASMHHLNRTISQNFHAFRHYSSQPVIPVHHQRIQNAIESPCAHKYLVCCKVNSIWSIWGWAHHFTLWRIRGNRYGGIYLYLGEVCEIGLENLRLIGRVDSESVGAIQHGEIDGAILEIQKDPVMHHVKFRNDLSVAPRSGHSFGSIRCHCCRLYIHIHIHMTTLLTKTTTNAPLAGVSIFSFTAASPHRGCPPIVLWHRTIVMNQFYNQMNSTGIRGVTLTTITVAFLSARLKIPFIRYLGFR